MFKPSQSTVSTPLTTIIIRSFDDVGIGSSINATAADDAHDDHEDGTDNVHGDHDVHDDHDDHDDGQPAHCAWQRFGKISC